jgi:hypothetical protein
MTSLLQLAEIKSHLRDALEMVGYAEKRHAQAAPLHYGEADLGRAAWRIADALSLLAELKGGKGIGISSPTGRGACWCPSPGAHGAQKRMSERIAEAASAFGASRPKGGR